MPDATKAIARIVELSNIARREGVRALENERIDDPFLAKAAARATPQNAGAVDAPPASDGGERLERSLESPNQIETWKVRLEQRKGFQR